MNTTAGSSMHIPTNWTLGHDGKCRTKKILIVPMSSDLWWTFMKAPDKRKIPDGRFWLCDVDCTSDVRQVDTGTRTVMHGITFSTTSIATERANDIATVCGELQPVNHPSCFRIHGYYSLTRTQMEFTIFGSIFGSISSGSVKNRLSDVVKYFNA